MKKPFELHERILKMFGRKIPNSDLYEAMENISNRFKSIKFSNSEIHMQDETSITPIIESTDVLMIRELRRSNEILNATNGELLQTLRAQHESNTKSEKLNLRLSSLNIFLAVVSATLAFKSFFPSESEKAAIFELKKQSAISTEVLNELRQLRASFDTLVLKMPIARDTTSH